MDGYFSVDSSTGVIRTARPLDREVIALHNLTILATESRKSLIYPISNCGCSPLVVGSSRTRQEMLKAFFF